MPNVPLVLGEAVMILGADRRALSAAFLAARLEGESTFSKIAAAGGVAMLGMGVAAATGIGAAVKAASKLEFAVSGAGAVAYATTAQLAAMTKQSLELSASSTFSATEIAGAMEIMVKAGTSLEDVLNGGTQAAVTLAQAGGVTLAQAGDVVATSMQLWDISAQDLTSTINEVAAAANVSRFDVTDLSRAIASGGITAKTAGVPFDEFMTTIAATATAFNTGADAGVAFKTFMNRLMPLTKTAKEEMERLGIVTKDGLNQFYTAEGDVKPMIEVIDVLNKSFGNLTKAEKILSFRKIFGERGGRMALALTDIKPEEFQELDKYMKSLDAGEIAAARLDNAQGAAQRLLRTVQALGVEFGMGFLERIKRGAQVATQELPKIVDALRAGLTGKMPEVRITTPTVETLRTVKNTSEEAAPRGMPGAGPSNMELMAERVGTAFRTNVLPRLQDFVSFINAQVLPALTRFAQHDIWPKLLTFAHIVGTILVGGFRALTAVLGPVVGWLSQHKEVLGGLITSYITYITVSKAVALATLAQAKAMAIYQGAVKAMIAVQGAYSGAQASFGAGQIAIAARGSQQAAQRLAAAQSAQRAAQAALTAANAGTAVTTAGDIIVAERRVQDAISGVTAARLAETRATEAYTAAQAAAKTGVAAEIAAATARQNAARAAMITSRQNADASIAHAAAVRASNKSTVAEIAASQAAASKAMQGASDAAKASAAADASVVTVAANARAKAASNVAVASKNAFAAQGRLATATQNAIAAESALDALRQKGVSGRFAATNATLQVAAAERTLRTANTEVAAAQTAATLAANRLAIAQTGVSTAANAAQRRSVGLAGVFRLLVTNGGLLMITLVALAGIAIVLYKNWDAIQKVFGEFSTVIALLVGGLGLAITAWVGYITIAGQATLAQWALNTAMAANPVGLVVAGIAAIVGALALLYLNLGRATRAWNDLGFAMRSAFGQQAANAIQSGIKFIVQNLINAMPTLLGFTRAIQGLFGLIDRIRGADQKGGKPAGEVGGRTPTGVETVEGATPQDVPRDEEGRPLSLPEREQTVLRTSGDDPNWRTAPPSNPDYMAPPKRPPAPKGMHYTSDDESSFDLEADEGFGDYEPPPVSGWQMPDAEDTEEGAAAKKTKEAEDKMKSAVDSLNARFFNDLSEELFKNPNQSLGPLIAKQAGIRAEIARTAEMLMNTLGVDMPTAFEKASELVLARIDDMEKELEGGPKLNGWLGFLAAAFEENMAKFNVGLGSATAKAGDTYQVFGGVNITPDPDIDGQIDLRKVDSAWKQVKLVKGPE